MSLATYDWAWRKRAQEESNGVMTFASLYHEAIEVCSPELFLRRAYAKAFVSEAYMHGGFERSECFLLFRFIEQAFVRAYLFERRAGVPLRAPGPPAGSDIVVNEAQEAARMSSDRERLRFHAIRNAEKKAVKEREREIAQDRADDALSSLLGHEYRHYEGGHYRVLSTSVDKPTNKVLVLYYSTGVERSMRWTCTLEHFTERVIVTGNPMPRFEKIPDNI